MGRMYTITFESVAVSAAIDLFEILAPADACLVIHGLSLSQSSEEDTSTDNEQLHVAMKRVTGSPTSGSGGSTPTPAPLAQGDAAAGFTTETVNTTQLSGGTSTTLWAEDFNVFGGYQWLPTPEMRPVISPSTYFVVSLSAPDDAVTMSGVLVVEEVGG